MSFKQFGREFFERLCETAENEYVKNPTNEENFTIWGAALLELSFFHRFPESKKMAEEAVAKMEEGLSLNPKNKKTLWFLGEAHSAQAYLIPYQTKEESKAYNDKATEYFERAIEAGYSDAIHRKTWDWDVAEKVCSETCDWDVAAKILKKKKSSDPKYHIFGCVILVVAIVAWVGFAKSNK